VALIQPSIPQYLIWDENEKTNRFRKLVHLSEEALVTHPDVLVWPESALPNLPIVAVSAEEINPRLQRSKSSTVFLPKPIEYEQFYTLIVRFLPGQMTSRARSKCLPV